MAIRSISNGIPLGAVRLAKRQIEKMVARKAGGGVAAISLEPPPSYVVSRNINGVPQDVRRLSVSVFERAVESAIGRRLLERANRDNPWAVVSALFDTVGVLTLFSDKIISRMVAIRQPTTEFIGSAIV